MYTYMLNIFYAIISHINLFRYFMKRKLSYDLSNKFSKMKNEWFAQYEIM